MPECGPQPEEIPKEVRFSSILFKEMAEPLSRAAPDFFRDLNLDQIIEAVTRDVKEYDLTPFFHTPLTDPDAILYRQEIMRDLEDKSVREATKLFAQKMRLLRQRLDRSKKLHYQYEKEKWFLSSADVYCEAVQELWKSFSRLDIKSRGMRGFCKFLSGYVETPSFQKLTTDAGSLKSELSMIRYCLNIKDSSITVLPYDDEIDYSGEVEKTFEKFRQAAPRDYRIKFSDTEGINHIDAQIVDGVAKLNPGVFQALGLFYAQHGDYIDETLLRFDREIQFYLAYLGYIDRFRNVGLCFCYPEISNTSKETRAFDTFDLALAKKLLEKNVAVVRNDFHLMGPERMFVVSGPNQGGKTTFARLFGQLHYLASLGLPVPGIKVRLFLPDRLFSHFEKEEDIQDLHGKLQDDLIRIHDILNKATPSSVIILNEAFSSTTISDAVFLSKKVMERISHLDCLAVWVTFLDELASFNEKTVSLVSVVDPNSPAIRTYKLKRMPASGIAYALLIAEKYRVTYDWLKKRLKP